MLRHSINEGSLFLDSVDLMVRMQMKLTHRKTRELFVYQEENNKSKERVKQKWELHNWIIFSFHYLFSTLLYYKFAYLQGPLS